MRVDRLRYRHVGPLTFTVRAGEVLGIFGLVGAGRTELLEVLAGARRADEGSVVFHDGAGLPHNPKEAWVRGIAILPEDRKRAGIASSFLVLENTRLAARRQSSAWLFDKREKALALPLLRRLAVRAASVMQPVGTLSGGNQQKVVLARCLSVSPRLLLLEEPTRGVDVRTRSELYTLIGELAASGLTVVFASSELPEVLAFVSTVLVLAHGQQTLLLPNAGLTEAQVLNAAFHLAAPAA